MVQAISARIYNPPALPAYLKNVYDLKPILGFPNDDEVKGIHVVLRMAHSVAHIPEIFDPQLTMNLMQHLFEVQMSRYREKYPCGMFPEDMVHTPPNLPSYISVTLEPVHGVPSDNQLQGVQAAIRAYEKMAIVPSMFDPKVGMELSQYLFNIQLARYMHDVPKAELGSKSKPRSKKRNSSQSSRSRPLVDPASNGSDEETVGPSNDTSAGEPAASDRSTVQDQPIQPDNILGVTTNNCNHNQLSEKVFDALESIRRVLITTQQSSSRGIMQTRWLNGKGFYVEGHEIMNDEGVLPTSQGLPRIGRDGYGCTYSTLLSDNQLAQYLRFYGIGQDLIETGDTSTIRSGQRRNAEVRLRDFVN